MGMFLGAAVLRARSLSRALALDRSIPLPFTQPMTGLILFTNMHCCEAQPGAQVGAGSFIFASTVKALKQSLQL